MLRKFTGIVWACVAVGLVITLIAGLLGDFSDSSGAHNSAKAANFTPVTTLASPTVPLASQTATPHTIVATPTLPPATPVSTLTPGELAQYKPNELGWIMVLMYHAINHDGGDYATTPDELRADLQWLYEHNFYVVPASAYIKDEIKAPAGKRPVVLTFDDGEVSQFRYLVDAAGKKTIDPDCAVGILEKFYADHPDFGHGGALFSILPLAPFAWPDAEDQVPYEKEKVQFLIDHGYEIGNHTINHINMKQATNDDIKKELAGAVNMMRQFSPQAQMQVIAVPFGEYPLHGDTTLFEGFDYEGQHYASIGALMVGANPGQSPEDQDFDPYWIPRIRGSRDQIDKWFSFAEDNPGILYVSDGNPDTITVPNTLGPTLTGALDQSKLHGKTLIRY
jgi:peptidoglycan/xylan/chitin deacetylase (PgdA/CDA1 family)